MTCRYCCQKLPHVCADEYRAADVNVAHVYPPIPARNYDYCATFAGYEPGDPQGWGATEREARKALWEQLA